MRQPPRSTPERPARLKLPRTLNRGRPLWAAMTLACLSPPLAATPICRWVDASGRHQIAEVVPDRYKKVAICSDSQKHELSPEQRRAVDRRLKEERASADREAARSSAVSPAGPASAALPGEAAAPLAVKRPTEVVTGSTDCPTWWRLYEESADCFGPFRTAGGATRAEAFEVCNVVQSPEPQCGPRRR